MPALQRFLVTQTRTVEITAASMGEACDAGRIVLAKGEKEPVGNLAVSVGRIKIKRLEVDAL